MRGTEQGVTYSADIYPSIMMDQNLIAEELLTPESYYWMLSRPSKFVLLGATSFSLAKLMEMSADNNVLSGLFAAILR